MHSKSLCVWGGVNFFVNFFKKTYRKRKIITKFDAGIKQKSRKSNKKHVQTTVLIVGYRASSGLALII